MNNAKIAIDYSALAEEEVVDNAPLLQEREAKLVKLIEAIAAVQGTREWSVLKELLFTSLETSLEKRLLEEARKETPDPVKIAKVNGQLMWANKYADLSKLATSFRLELKNIRLQLHGKSKDKKGRDNGDFANG